MVKVVVKVAGSSIGDKFLPLLVPDQKFCVLKIADTSLERRPERATSVVACCRDQYSVAKDSGSSI